jgi:AmmeMemoRadiSam system protein B
MDARSRPALRPVESIVVPDKRHGRVLVLRDTRGVTEAHAVVPPVLVPVVARFTGGQTCEDIAREASEEVGVALPVDVVVRLAEELERGLFLDGERFQAALARVEREFAEAAVRPASHAGGAYYGERHALERYIEQACFAKAHRAALPPRGPHPTAAGSANAPSAADLAQKALEVPLSGIDHVAAGAANVRSASQGRGRDRMVALVAPHIDPWRGAVSYGHAYGALAAALPPKADTFILFGTSHAPMREPFALCRKAFATPLGTVDADLASIDALAARAEGFDPFADQLNHKREHSLEFQVVFLKHVLKDRPARIVPILAGLGAQQASREDPGRDAHVTRFVDGIRELVESRPGRVVVVAGADLAHVGPRFGDERALGAEERGRLEHADRTSLEHAASLDAGGFWGHVAGDLEARRVCGLAPIWSLLRSISKGVRGRLLHYEQTIDRDDGSIVSHAAVGFYG